MVSHSWYQCTKGLQKTLRFCRVCFGERFCPRPVCTELLRSHASGVDRGLALPTQTIVHLENRRSRFLSVEQLYLGDCRSAELPEKPALLGAETSAVKHHDSPRRRMPAGRGKTVGFVFHNQQGAYLWDIHRTNLNTPGMLGHSQPRTTMSTLLIKPRERHRKSWER